MPSQLFLSPAIIAFLTSLVRWQKSVKTMQDSDKKKFYTRHNMQDLMRPVKGMLDLCSKHTKAVAKGGIGRPFNNWKRENQQGWRHDRYFKNERYEFQGIVRDPWENVEAFKYSCAFFKIVIYSTTQFWRQFYNALNQHCIHFSFVLSIRT